MGSRVRGQGSHTSSNMPGGPITDQPRPRACVRVLCSHAHAHTHTLSHTGGLPFQAFCPPTPVSRLQGPRPAPPSHGSDCVEDAAGFSFVHSKPGASKPSQGNRSWVYYPSSTFSPPPPESNQMTRSPLLTASDKPTWAGTTCPNMHSSTTTHRFPQHDLSEMRQGVLHSGTRSPQETAPHTQGRVHRLRLRMPPTRPPPTTQAQLCA